MYVLLRSALQSCTFDSFEDWYGAGLLVGAQVPQNGNIVSASRQQRPPIRRDGQCCCCIEVALHKVHYVNKDDTTLFPDC